MIDTLLGGTDHLLRRGASIPNSLKDFDQNQLSNEWSLGSEIAHGAVATVYNAKYKGLPSQYVMKLLTPDRTNAENEFLTHTVALSILGNKGLSELVAPSLVSYGIYKATPAVIEKRMDGAFHSELEFYDYFNSLSLDLRLRFLTDLATTMSQAALCGVYPYITKGSNLFLTKHKGVGIIDYGKAYIVNFSDDHPQLMYSDSLYPEKHANRHSAGTNSYIEFFRYLEKQGLNIVKKDGHPSQKIAGIEALLHNHKEKPITVDNLFKEVSALHIEDVKQVQD